MESSFKTLLKSMPDKVGQLIFGQLALKWKKRCRLVCKRWKSLLDEQLVFRVILNDATSNYVQNFGRKRPISQLVVGFFSKMYPENGLNLTVKDLKILPDFRYEVFYETNRNNGNNDVFVTPETKLKQLINEFKDVETIRISSVALADMKYGSFLKEQDFPNLKYISILVESDYGLDGVQDILLNNYNSLEELVLTVNNDDELTLYEETFTCLGNHSDTLKTLISTQPFRPNIHVTRSRLNTSRDHTLPPVEYANLLTKLSSFAKLETLDIFVISSEGKNRKNLLLHTLQCQKQLTTLILHNLTPDNMPVWRTIPSILLSTASGSTLRHILLDGCFCNSSRGDPPGPFSGRYFTQCKSLETLEFLVCGIKIMDLGRFPKKCLKSLALGHALTVPQVKYIIKYFENLEQLSLPQSNILNPIFVDKEQEPCPGKVFSVLQFKMALSMPKLEKLYIRTDTSRHMHIKKVAAGLLGVLEESPSGFNKRGDVYYQIDRNIFQSAD